MKTTELIVKLQDMVKEYGDLDVKVETAVSYSDVDLGVRDEPKWGRILAFQR